VTGIFSGLNLVIWSMLLTNMFLGPAIHYVSHLFHVKSPIMYIIVGISLIALLIVITHYTEVWVQHITQKVVVDIDLDKI
jgi:NO-binding membrane sensor protein with MHYT domain